MDLLAISNLPWDTYFPPGVGPELGDGPRTHLAGPGEITPWLSPPLCEQREGEGIGGSPSNAALAFAGLGGAASLVGPVADDAFGERVRTELRRHGVPLHEVQPPPPEQAHSLAFRRSAGERRFLATMPRLSLEAGVSDVAWGGPGWILASAYELRDPGMRRITLHGFEEARKGGRSLAFDLADPNFVRHAREAVDRILGLGLEVLQAGEEALAVLTEGAIGGQGPEALGALAHIVLITRGAGGVRICHQGRLWDLGPKAGEVRDTTGAGDAFLGAFLFGRIRGLGVPEAAALGLAAAGEAVAILGARVSPEASAIPQLGLARGDR